MGMRSNGYGSSLYTIAMIHAARIISEHTRTVNRVQFHSLEPTMLLSGSQDGTMKMWVCYLEGAATLHMPRLVPPPRGRHAAFDGFPSAFLERLPSAFVVWRKCGTLSGRDHHVASKSSCCQRHPSSA
jgi:hypothetical protein